MYKVYVSVKRREEVSAALERHDEVDTVGLIRELKYYFNARETACCYQPYGEARIRYDDRLTLTVYNDRDTIRVLKAVRG
jgi:hypothetical protein